MTSCPTSQSPLTPSADENVDYDALYEANEDDNEDVDMKSHGSVITAKVPMSEMLEYASVLTSMTGGKGEFHLEFSHYEEVPSKLRRKIIEAAQVKE